MAPWYAKLDPTPAFPPYTGPYTVGTHDVEISADQVPATVQNPDPNLSTLAFRVFYPCQTPASSRHPPTNVNWLSDPQRGILSGYARFLGVSPFVANLSSCLPSVLSHIKIPAHKDAPVADAPSDGRWPVIVFSHGLGGSRNAYSHLCGSLASYGIVVFAPDHRDGSQPVAFTRATSTSAARSIDYFRLPHKPSPEVYEGRDKQLKTRLWEVSGLVEALSMIDQGMPLNNLCVSKKNKNNILNNNPLQMLQGKLAIEAPGSIGFAGHSFGAVTTIQLIKSAFYHRQVTTHLFKPIMPSGATDSPAPKIIDQVSETTPVFLLDPWALPLSSPATSDLAAKPLPCFSSQVAPGGEAVLSVLSDAFVKWEANYKGIREALADPDSATTNRPSAHVFYPIQSAHLSQSDFGVLFPNLTKYLAKALEPARTIELNVRAMLEVMRQAGSPVAEPRLVGKDALERAIGQGVVEEATMVDADKDSGVDVGSEPVFMPVSKRGDGLILSRTPGTVRGWVFLDAQVPAEEVAKAAKMAGESAKGAQKVKNTARTTSTINMKEMSGAQAEHEAAVAGKDGIVHDGQLA